MSECEGVSVSSVLRVLELGYLLAQIDQLHGEQLLPQVVACLDDEGFHGPTGQVAEGAGALYQGNDGF